MWRLLMQKKRAKETLREMKKELKKLKQEITFREYIGFEMCLQMFEKRYQTFLNAT